MIFSGSIAAALAFGWACPICRAEWASFLRRVEDQWKISNSQVVRNVIPPEQESDIATGPEGPRERPVGQSDASAYL